MLVMKFGGTSVESAEAINRVADIVRERMSRHPTHPGTHEIGFDSAADTITLQHSARSREGFARGALKAAQWIIGKKGVFEFSEIFL
jgi:dihydrodipicolinate reductase